MNKGFIHISLLSLMLAGCSTTDRMGESQQATLSEEEQRIRREEIRENLRQYQMEVIRSGMPPLPIPLNGSQVIEKDIFKPELSPEMRKIIHLGCVREMKQACRKLCHPAVRAHRFAQVHP